MRKGDPKPTRFLKVNSYDQTMGFVPKRIIHIIERNDPLLDDYSHTAGWSKLEQLKSTSKVQPFATIQRRPRVSRSMLIDVAKRRQECREFTAINDRLAKRRARSFISRVRQMNLSEMPKLDYFAGMIQESSKQLLKDKRKRRRKLREARLLGTIDRSCTLQPLQRPTNRHSIPGVSFESHEKYSELRQLLGKYTIEGKYTRFHQRFRTIQ